MSSTEEDTADQKGQKAADCQCFHVKCLKTDEKHHAEKYINCYWNQGHADSAVKLKLSFLTHTCYHPFSCDCKILELPGVSAPLFALTAKPRASNLLAVINLPQTDIQEPGVSVEIKKPAHERIVQGQAIIYLRYHLVWCMCTHSLQNAVTFLIR